MNLAAIRPELLESSRSPGIYFTMSSRYGNDIPVAAGEKLSVRSSLRDRPLLDGIIEAKPGPFLQALDSARSGATSRIGFSVEIQRSVTYYELYSFPLGEENAGDIGCLLVDRTPDEVDRTRIDSRMHELDLIIQVVHAFAETRDLSEILRIILLAVTAGNGLGFNRGFILLSDDARESLWGCMGIGPSSPEEAGRIWSSLSQNPMTFDETLRLYKSCGVGDAQVNKLILSIRIPLSENADFIARAVREKKSVVIGPEMIQSDEDRALKSKFDVDFLAVVPLIARDSLQGVILADNIITGRPILQSDLNVLEIFAKYASDAIENSRLYGTLENQISLLKEANEKIIRSRENLVRAEKLSSVGKMALEVAHEIRNPLTIIGGHANLRLRKMAGDEGSRKTLELISSQVRRIEDTLDKFSSVVRLSEKKEDRFPLIELVQETLGMLASASSISLPKLIVDDAVGGSLIFTDRGLFHQALMAILKEASRITRGMQNVIMTIKSRGNAAMIFIYGGENNHNFAENFYSGLRKRDEEGRYQEMAVALEIIQHYGGDIGIGSVDGLHGRLYIEIPLCEEVS